MEKLIKIQSIQESDFKNPVQYEAAETCPKSGLLEKIQYRLKKNGPTHFYQRLDIINVDMYPYREVDIVAKATHLPVRDSCIDFIINVAVLEHIDRADRAVGEIHRVLKAESKNNVEFS